MMTFMDLLITHSAGSETEEPVVQRSPVESPSASVLLYVPGLGGFVTLPTAEVFD